MATSRPLRYSALALRYITLTLTVSAVVGCSNSTINYQQDADSARTARTQWQYQQQDAVAVTQLTQLVAMPALTSLVEEAILQNPSLQQTAIALQIAYAQRGVTTSGRIPQVNAGFSAKNSDADESYQTDVTVSWELDLWQKLNDEVQAADMDIASSQATYQGARDALAANIMRSWLQINLQQQLITIETSRLAVLENNEQFVLSRYRNGLGALEDLDSARTSSAQTRATLAEQQETLAQNQRNLGLLIGQTTAIQAGSDFPTVLQPLAGLPEQDLGRRPDLQAAYAAISAAQYRTDVAYKALLPSISLSASLTDIANSPSESLLTSPAWSLLGQLTAPIFQGGQLRSQIEIAELTTEQTYWAYQENLLTAVNEVENALGQEQSLQRQQQHLSDALSSAKRSESNYQTKYRQGLVDILDLLTVQQQTFDLQSQLTQATYNRLVNRIDLGLALGLGITTDMAGEA
ncbi:TolC family protein [Moritella marina ATCC 15381]|uniref:TolC family protein n=1 Tax=Moritella marina ATCC 15381 TaxID=1202962 RepID=A0A5J6WGB5_MORMI|nr:TolC family protein [Moritella marina]QFI37047.1 TolC family protein [Moritella marina ATCC 15381]